MTPKSSGWAESAAGSARLVDLRARWAEALSAELPGARALRRRLHREPCRSGEEEPTARLIEEAMGLSLERVATTGRWGRLGPARGPAVLVRAELDALPVHEETGVEFASTNGAMHACGHDVHLAALVAVVRAARGLALPVALLPVLQPREETYPSGALDVVESGLISAQSVGAAVGAHVHPGIPEGHVATGAGVVNAAADEIIVTVSGVGGHGAYPHEAADPVSALAHIVLALPDVVRRTVSPMHPAVVSVGHVAAGGAGANVLPSTARLMATLRTVDDRDRRDVQEAVRRLVEHQAAASGTRGEVEIVDGEPTLHNDPGLVDRVDAWLARSDTPVTEPMRSLGADDFSYFCAAVPSVMCFVGVRTPDVEGAPSLHHPRFLPGDDAIATVAGTYLDAYLGAAELLTAQGDA